MGAAARVVVLGLLAVSVVLSAAFATASALNYPGGQALQRLLARHIPASAAAPGSTVRVHIDVAPAMTGVTRFGQLDAVRLRGAGAGAGDGDGNDAQACPSGSRSECPSGSGSVFVTYSKEEGRTAFDDFDWLLTDDVRWAPPSLSTFSRVAYTHHPFPSPPLHAGATARRQALPSRRKSTASAPWNCANRSPGRCCAHVQHRLFTFYDASAATASRKPSLDQNQSNSLRQSTWIINTYYFIKW